VLGRSWRLAATALSFAVFGIGGLVAGVLFVLLLALPRRARQRVARAVNRVLFRSFLRFMALVGVVELDIDRQGIAALGAGGGRVIVANHPTLLDVMVLLGYVEQANCVVKSRVWRNPFMAAAVTAANYIPNEDLEQILRDSAAALARGESLIVFPEATRSVPGEPLRLQRGAASIALHSDAVVDVVHLRCEPVFLTKNRPWYRVPDRRPCLAARVGASLRAREYLRGGASRGIAARRLTEALQEELTKGVPFDARAGAGAQTAAH
jgi:1-acyl-sn-glycerol-3-phosphate acyltransferase